MFYNCVFFFSITGHVFTNQSDESVDAQRGGHVQSVCANSVCSALLSKYDDLVVLVWFLSHCVGLGCLHLCSLSKNVINALKTNLSQFKK